MKKYLIAFFGLLVFPLLVWATVDTWDGQTQIDTWDGQTQIDTSDGVVHVAAGGCDDCSGTLVMAVHFEDNTGSDLETGTPCGCSDGSDKVYTLASATHSSTQASDGTYSISASGENYTVTIDNTGIAAAVSSVGTYCVDYYRSAAGSARVFTLGTGVYGRVTDGAGADDNTIQIDYDPENAVGTDTFADATWTRICYSWDESQATTGDKISTKVGANAWEEKTGITLSDPGLGAPIYIVSGSWQDGRGYFDNIKIYSTYQAE